MGLTTKSLPFNGGGGGGRIKIIKQYPNINNINIDRIILFKKTKKNDVLPGTTGTWYLNHIFILLYIDMI